MLQCTESLILYLNTNENVKKLPSKVGYLSKVSACCLACTKWTFSNMNFESCLELFYSLLGWGNCTPAPPVPPALMLRMVSWLLVKVPTGWFTEFDTGSRHLYAKIAQWKIDHLGYRILQKIEILEKNIKNNSFKWNTYYISAPKTRIWLLQISSESSGKCIS